MTASPISATVDFDADGVQHGFLRLPYSRDDSAWGAIMIPVTVAKNGDGPTALLTGANHGDEYEGPVALFDLANGIDAAAIRGRVIILPALNYPAFRAGTRTSPIDKGNLNRLFPGRPDGTVTEKIAHYIQSELLPMADLVLDIHSGGKTLDFLPYAAAHVLPDKDQEARCWSAAAAFGAPYTMRMLEMDAVGMLDTAVEEMGKVFVTTELGGGGTTRPGTVAIAKRGIRNVLRHAGIREGGVEAARSVRIDMPSEACFVVSETAGLVEPVKDLGDRVAKGEAVARIHSTERTGAPPVELLARIDGILAARHFPGLIQTGDCAAVVAVIMA